MSRSKSTSLRRALPLSVVLLLTLAGCGQGNGVRARRRWARRARSSRGEPILSLEVREEIA
jgi:hypothetical protein